MAIGGVGDHQRLHGQAVFLHQVGDTRVRVDHDLVRQAHLAALVAFLGGEEVLAEGPVVVRHRHAHRGVGIHHLFGGDDFELVGVGVQAELFGHPADFLVRQLDQVEGPFRLFGQGARVVGISWHGNALAI